MMGLLDRAGARLTARPDEADILVVRQVASVINSVDTDGIDDPARIGFLQTQRLSGDQQDARRLLIIQRQQKVRWDPTGLWR